MCECLTDTLVKLQSTGRTGSGFLSGIARSTSRTRCIVHTSHIGFGQRDREEVLPSTRRDFRRAPSPEVSTYCSVF